tara:strand:+ start:113 stop:1999 length:1887 start_codon:yes stop_codon:yes gene_type:complete
MPLVDLTAPAGVVTEITDYQAGLRYTSADKVRFKYDQAEKIGGWYKRDSSSSAMSGVPRNILPHRDSNGAKMIFFGTSTHVYSEYGGTIQDVTPYKTANVSLTNPFTTGTAGSSVVTVTDAGNTIAQTSPPSRIIISSIASGTVDGVTITPGEYLATYVSATQYTITAVAGTGASISGTASSGSTTGGGAVVLRYLVSNGPADGLTGFGFGTGLWSSSTWGTARSTSGVVLSPRVWTMDAWGEDIVASIGGGEDTLYYFDVSAFIAAPATYRGETLGQYVTGIGGDASAIPTKVGVVLVSTPDRHIVVFGSTPEGSATYDRMTVRWCSQESLSDWNTQITNTAGATRLGTGTNIESAAKARGQMVLWTDVDMYSMQFTGPPFTFSFQQLGEASGTISKNSPAMIEGGAFWMGVDNFYAYDGAVKTLKCPVLNHVFNSFNQVQREKVFSAEIIEFNEIWWFYPSAGQTEVDKYVIFNYIDNTWSIGSLSRTAWHDAGIYTYPIATNGSGFVYNQEYGYNDESSAMTASIETGFFTGDQAGNSIYFIDKIIPDTTFVGTGTKQIKFQMKSKLYPNTTETTKGPFTLAETKGKLNMRSRGRSFQSKYYTDNVDIGWRLGTWRMQAQADGLR